jgi:hypothetical protein
MFQEYRMNEKGVGCYIESAHSLCIFIVHLRAVEIPKFRVNDINDNTKLRILYLRNIIDETEFKRRLFISQKKYEVKKEICGILALFRDNATDILYRYYDALNKTNSRENMIQTDLILNEFQSLIQYSNDCFKVISDTFKNSKYSIVSTTYDYSDLRIVTIK